jgi:hypothetical protein
MTTDDEHYTAVRTQWERELAACRGVEDRHNLWHVWRSYLHTEHQTAWRIGRPRFEAFMRFRPWAAERVAELRAEYYPGQPLSGGTSAVRNCVLTFRNFDFAASTDD